jgi:hypothetical protein
MDFFQHVSKNVQLSVQEVLIGLNTTQTRLTTKSHKEASGSKSNSGFLRMVLPKSKKFNSDSQSLNKADRCTIKQLADAAKLPRPSFSPCTPLLPRSNQHNTNAARFH